ncbi:hypothetical protein [Bacillus sp. EB01]|uniref:hypothetical protein n=1 Tax=Bacillus sp. EB01 TaxID=1347086 RepID=UPI0005C51234|nr:hypothetical protein [Bacillus sp. EB01]
MYKKEMINGKETIVLTEKGMEQVIYPMDAHKKIPTIIGEPIISPSISYFGGKEETILTYAWYPTSSPTRFVSVHNTNNEKKSVDEMIDVLIPKSTTPLYGSKITEMNINGKKAVLYEPTTDIGVVQLFIVTEKYVYYLSNSGAEEKQGNSKELIQLAELFNFEAEK